MAAVMRFHDGGSFRLGHDCHVWGDDYNRALSFEVDRDRPDVAIIGGLTWRLSNDEYRWLQDVLIENRFRAAVERVVRGHDGKPLRDAKGAPILRRKLMPMPALKSRGRADGV